MPRDPATDELIADWETLAGVDVPRMTDEELRDFVSGFCNGHIFTSSHVGGEEDELLTVFLPLAFGALSQYSSELLATIGVLWEYLAEALPRTHNGRPSFASMRIMHIEDWDRARAAIQREWERRKNIEV